MPMPDDVRQPNMPPRTRNHSWRLALRKLLIIAAVLTAGTAAAQECVWELEPNDLPHQATLITTSGPACLAGEFSASDQDIFLWELSGADAGQLWIIELEGFSEGLTRLDFMQLDFLENQTDVTARHNLLQVESLYGQSQSSEPFLLQPGRYWFGLSKAGGAGDYVVNLRTVGPAPASTGNPAAPRTGPFSQSSALPDGLALPWQIGTEDADTLWRIELRVPLQQGAEIVLDGPAGTIASGTTDANGFVMLDGLGLGSGDFTIRVNGAVANHQLSASRRGRQADGNEVEPNNSIETANTFPPGSEIRGTLTDADWFMIDVDAAAAWTLGVEASAELALRLEDAAGNVLIDRSQVSTDLESLVFTPGTYYLRATGTSGTSYTLSLQSATAPAAGWEVEPNDGLEAASAITPEGQLRGVLTGPRDADILAFHLEGEAQLYRVQLAGQGHLDLSLLNGAGSSQANASGPQRVRLDNLHLMPGTHYFRVSGDPGEYAMRLLSLGPVPEVDLADLPAPDEPLQATPAAPPQQAAPEAAAAPQQAELPPMPPAPAGIMELEPNDDTTRAMLLTPGIPRVGSLHSRADADYYRFFLADDQPVRLEIVGPADVAPVPMRVTGHGWIEAPRGTEPGTVVSADLWLLAGDHYVEVRSVDTQGGWYQLRLTQLNGAMPVEETAALPLEITVSSSEPEVAAYWHQGQNVSLTAEIRNTGSSPLSLQLDATTTDARANVSVQESLDLAAGASMSVPLSVNLPADLRDDVPLNVSLAASTAEGSSGGQLALIASCDALAVNPADWWGVPQTILGRQNLLWSAYGAALHGPHEHERRALALFDGAVTPAYGSWAGSTVPAEFITVKLPGSTPAELLGAVLHPLTERALTDQMRAFRIETSVDGTNFTTAYTGELAAVRIDQTFLFDQPVRASYVRLVAIDDQNGRTGGGYVGEMRIIASDPGIIGTIDLADSSLGGHVVWSDPYSSDNIFLQNPTSPNRVDVRETAGQFTFVLGFHNTRTAQLTRLEWQDFAAAVTSGEALEQVTVEVSLTGAAGPWEPLADWEFSRSSDGTAVLEFAEPTWARYLRFSGQASSPDQRYIVTPQRVSAIERAADGSSYLSILGEWGTGSQEAVYEYLNPPPASVLSGGADNNDSLQTATVLPSGGTAEGTVSVGEDIDWYRFSIAPGQNQLDVRLSGEPTISYVYELVDAAGQPVAASTRRSGTDVVLTLFGEPGDYFLKIEEPRRSVVFSWDTSGSMGPYRDITYSALTSFSTGINADRERVQLLAYEALPRGPQWLLPLWSGDAARIQQTVVNYDRRHDSSDSETAILKAVRALGQRQGTRALLLITDAETGSYDLTTEVWRALEEVQPRIFTFEVSSGGNLRPQQMMQDWAAVNHGHYTLAAAIGDLDNGFSRASCIMRRPKHYRIDTTSSTVAPPGPGSLQVSRPADALQPAVQIIFDASGSMGTSLPSGEQRITAAKRVLEELVTQGLPAGSPFALRAFGQVEPTTCNMRLEIPLGPLDPASAQQAVRGIEMKLLSQTPLADAILASGQDLSAAGRSRTLILITDGVESCGGDPAAAVRELRAVNPVDIAIVSLGIPPEQIAEFDALAEAIGASYVDVSSFEQLQASVAAAINPAFEVFDAAGELVATGVVDGPPVDLEMGVYTVRVFGAGVREYPGVQVPGESAVKLTHAGQ